MVISCKYCYTRTTERLYFINLKCPPSFMYMPTHCQDFWLYATDLRSLLATVVSFGLSVQLPLELIALLPPIPVHIVCNSFISFLAYASERRGPLTKCTSQGLVEPQCTAHLLNWQCPRNKGALHKLHPIKDMQSERSGGRGSEKSGDRLADGINSRIS